MAEPQQPSPPNDPLTAREDDIERLLAEAETLATEIATSTGDAPTAPEPTTAVEAGVPDAGSPDPVAATEAVEERLAELDELVSAESEAEDAAALNDAAAAGTDAVAVDPGSAPRVALDDTPGEAEEATAEESGESFEAVDAERARAEAQVPITLGSSEGVTPKDEERGQGADEAAAGPADEPPADPLAALGNAGEPAPKRPRRSLKEWLVIGRENAPRVAKAAALAVPHALLGILETIDRPFAGLSPTTKRYIGYLAIITLVMGIASLVLPGLLNDNPYANMPP